MNVDLAKLWDYIDKGGMIALTLIGLWAFITGRVVPRWVYQELKERCNQLTILLDRSTELADRNREAGEELRSQLRKLKEGQ